MQKKSIIYLCIVILLSMCSSNDRNLVSFIAANESSFEAEIQKVIDTLNES